MSVFPPRTKASLFAAVPLAAAITLVTAGCGTVSTPPGAAGTVPTVSAAPTGTPSSPAASVTPIPVGPGSADCTGWPASVPYETLPASFTPVAVIRCVADYETIPGKGEWLVATLQRADTGLTQLTDALRQPAGRTRPGVICPEYVILPPQIVLVSADGKMLRPRLPLNDCGDTQGQVLTALATLPWKAVSERQVAPVKANS
jgi:hypothetical protein